MIVIQTIAIGFGSVLGERMTEINEQRRMLLGEREAALKRLGALNSS